MRRADNFRNVVYLVLQKQPAAHRKISDGVFYLLRRYLHISAAEKQNAVLPVPVDLNYRVTARGFTLCNKRSVNAVVAQKRNEAAAVRADTARVADLRARTGERDGLVESLAAAEIAKLRRCSRLAGAHDMIDRIDHINIQRTEIQNLHFSMCLSVSSILSSIFTLPTPNICVSSLPWIGSVHSLPTADIPFIMPITEPAVAALQSVSKPV